MYCSRIGIVSRLYRPRIAGHTAAEMLDDFHETALHSGGKKRTGEKAGVEGCPYLLQVQNMEKNHKKKKELTGMHPIRA